MADQKFTDWMKAVETHIDQLSEGQGLTSGDLADFSYKVYFDQGLGPRAVAELSLRNNGWGSDDDEDDD